MMKPTKNDLSTIRREAAAKGHAARWGAPRGASRQIRVDVAAFEALQRVAELDRRRVASAAIISAAEKYGRKSSSAN